MVFHLDTLMPSAREAPPSCRLPPITGGRRSYHLLCSSSVLAIEFFDVAGAVNAAADVSPPFQFLTSLGISTDLPLSAPRILWWQQVSNRTSLRPSLHLLYEPSHPSAG